MRIVSLLPAGTEIVAALGALDQLVGVSHECDFPADVNRLPRVTHCPIHGAGLSGSEIDDWVKETLAAGGELYSLNTELLQELSPDVVITQRLCEVCAISGESVARALGSLPRMPEVVELSPNCLDDIFTDIRRIAEAIDVPENGICLVNELWGRVEAVRSRTVSAPRPVCFLMEWIDPPYCSGHWAPELVELAGGDDPLGRPGVDSVRILWDQVVDAQPEVLIAACCGWTAERTLQDVSLLRSYPGWETLPAVRNGRVFAVDASAYFSRHGPRVVDSLEILGELIHPELFPARDWHGMVVRVPPTELAVAGLLR